MKQILFFDDFAANRTDNTRRVFKQPEWDFDRFFCPQRSKHGILGESVAPAPGGGYYLYYYEAPPGAPFADEEFYSCVAHSSDDGRFEDLPLPLPAHPALPSSIGRGSGYTGIYVMRDGHEPNPDFLYKSPCAPFGNTEQGSVMLPPVLMASPDGIRWSRYNDVSMVPSYVDCDISLIYNPITGLYQATTRRRLGERRICLVESADLRSWSEPRAVLHPLPSDEPTTHLYGMPHFYYEAGDIFIGLLWKQVMPYGQVSQGPVTAEYAYSYDGRMWNRTGASILPFRARGELGGGCVYPFAVTEGNGGLRFYANATLTEHHGPELKNNTLPSHAVISGTMKHGRFVCIDSGKGAGEILTQHLMLNSPNLSLNVNAPFGMVRAQIDLSKDGRPVPGFSFEDCLPIMGDHTDIPLRWKGGTLERFCAERTFIRLRIAFEQAEIYGIHGDFLPTINRKAPLYERF